MLKYSVKKIISDAVFILLSLILAIGTITIFKACGPTEDGKYMSCHWAELMVAALGTVLTVQGIVRLFFVNIHARLGASIAALVTSILVIAVPNRLIRLCSMSNMQCQSVMKPAVTVISILIIVSLIIDIVLNSKDLGREKKK